MYSSLYPIDSHQPIIRGLYGPFKIVHISSERKICLIHKKMFSNKKITRCDEHEMHYSGGIVVFNLLPKLCFFELMLMCAINNLHVNRRHINICSINVQWLQLLHVDNTLCTVIFMPLYLS